MRFFKKTSLPFQKRSGAVPLALDGLDLDLLAPHTGKATTAQSCTAT